MLPKYNKILIPMDHAHQKQCLKSWKALPSADRLWYQRQSRTYYIAHIRYIGKISTILKILVPIL